MGELLLLGKGSRASPYRPLGAWFRFRLPPALLLNVPIGDWPRSPHDTRLFVGPTGEIRVHCRDASETYGRHSVLQVAATFLRALKPSSPETVAGMLTPGNGDAELNYQITIGAAVVIARTVVREPPTTAA